MRSDRDVVVACLAPGYKRAELIEQELTTDIEVRLDSLKSEMEVKNQAVIDFPKRGT